MREIILTEEPWLKVLLCLALLICVGVFTLVGLGVFVLSPAPHTSPWGHVSFICAAVAMLGLAAWYPVMKLRETSYFIVLKDFTLGITESGYQRIIPVSSITKITHTNLKQLHGIEQEFIHIYYHYQGGVKKIYIHNIKFLKKSLKLRNLELFLQTLQERHAQVSTQRWTEATEHGVSKKGKTTALVGACTLLAMLLLGSLFYYNEAYKTLLEANRAYCGCMDENIMHTEYGSTEVTGYTAYFEIHGKEIHCRIEKSDPPPQAGKIMLVEHWRGGLWGEAYCIGK